MLEWILDQPFGWAAAFLTAVAMVRSQCTYWVGRAARAGLLRSRFTSALDVSRTRRGVEAIERWGWPIVPLSFLTIGFQTAVNAGAGVIGWRWGRYTLAAIPGWIAWGVAYAASLLAAIGAAVALAARSPWLLGGAGVAAAITVAIAVARRRRRSSARNTVSRRGPS
jgi:membrane protein DedA with SNARE-associated domain